MRRYLGQHDTYRCGPIALLNLHKWQGLPVTGKHLSSYQRLCRCQRKDGTPSQAVDRVLGKRGRRMSYREFKNALWEDGGGAAVVLTRHPRLPSGGHFWFVPGIAQRSTDKRVGFLVVNFYRYSTLTLLTWPHMKWLLRHSRVWTFKQTT